MTDVLRQNRTSSVKTAATPLSPPIAGAAADVSLKAAGAPMRSKARKSAAKSQLTHSREAATPRPVSPAMLEIEVDHKFAEAQISIWVDEELTYTHPLQGTEIKHMVVFHRVQGHEFHAVGIPPGKHRLRVQVNPGASAREQSGSVEGEFTGGSEKMLRVHFNKDGEMALTLE